MTYKNERVPYVLMPITTQELYEKESRGSLNFRLKKQRKRGLWSPEQKSQLFTSMIQNDVCLPERLQLECGFQEVWSWCWSPS